jgi:uncharacterized protein YyaL (SSP411 family)
LVADAEVSSEPLHVTVVGSKSDAAAHRLFDEANRVPRGYLRVEWWDAAEGALPNPDVQYPQLPKPAAFLCTANACSAPVYAPEALAAKITASK